MSACPEGLIRKSSLDDDCAGGGVKQGGRAAVVTDVAIRGDEEGAGVGRSTFEDDPIADDPLREYSRNKISTDSQTEGCSCPKLESALMP